MQQKAQQCCACYPNPIKKKDPFHPTKKDVSLKTKPIRSASQFGAAEAPSVLIALTSSGREHKYGASWYRLKPRRCADCWAVADDADEPAEKEVLGIVLAVGVATLALRAASTSAGIEKR